MNASSCIPQKHSGHTKSSSGSSGHSRSISSGHSATLAPLTITNPILEQHPAGISSSSTPFTTRSIATGTCLKNSSLILGRYKVVKTIGKGTFGKVQLCQDTLFNNVPVAVKTIDHAYIKTARERKNIQREIRLVKILRHPYIIEILEMQEENNQTIIVMELAPHGELHDYVTQKKGLSQDEARKFFRQIVSAVDYCHQSSVVHRDLKPENLLIDVNYDIKLIDFGFGNTFSLTSTLTTYCGSPFYAAPEMTQGVPYTGPEVDIWSMGVILYSMLTAALPFNGSNINELYDAIASGVYDKCPAKINSDADKLLSRMLCVKPSERITMEEIKRHPWVMKGFKTQPINNYVPHRPSFLPDLDPMVLEELLDLGYDPKDYIMAFSKSYDSSPVKSLYHLHKEMLERAWQKQQDTSRQPCCTQAYREAAIAYSPPESPTVENGNLSTELDTHSQLSPAPLQEEGPLITPTLALMNLSQQFKVVDSLEKTSSISTPQSTPKKNPILQLWQKMTASPTTYGGKKGKTSPKGSRSSPRSPPLHTSPIK